MGISKITLQIKFSYSKSVKETEVCIGAISTTPIESLADGNSLYFLQESFPFLFIHVMSSHFFFSKSEGSSAVCFFFLFTFLFPLNQHDLPFVFTKPSAIKLLCSLRMDTKCSADCSLGLGDWVVNGKTSWEWLEELSYSGNAQLLNWRKLRTKGADSSLFNCYRPNKYSEEGKAGTLTERVASTLKCWSSAEWDLASIIS